MCSLLGREQIDKDSENRTHFPQAEGRDSESNPGPTCISRQVCIPQMRNGTMKYIIMDVIATSDTDAGWRVKELPAQQLPISSGPEAVTSKRTSGHAGYGWNGKAEPLE